MTGKQPARLFPCTEIFLQVLIPAALSLIAPSHISDRLFSFMFSSFTHPFELSAYTYILNTTSGFHIMYLNIININDRQESKSIHCLMERLLHDFEAKQENSSKKASFIWISL